jgi:hypothetical protein
MIDIVAAVWEGQMLIEELHWSARNGWKRRSDAIGGADLVLYFGERGALRDSARFDELRQFYPNAHIVGGSASATVLERTLYRQDIVAAALKFDRTRIVVATRTGVAKENSRACGEELAAELRADDLAGVFVLADGIGINGSLLVAGLKDGLGSACPISGGMAGDSCEYRQPVVGADAAPASGGVAAIGFYGRNVRLSYGNACGWDAFGPRRRVTRASGNVLYELDGKPALALYERYLGDEVINGVPASVLFPLQMSHPDRPERNFVRAALSLDQTATAMTLAGNVPEGWMARLMRGSLDRLALAAAKAARDARDRMTETVAGDRLALMVSCTGRMLLMGQRTIEEIEFAAQEIGSAFHCLGFYSFGEIAPTAAPAHAELHNQTMTITGLAEVA